MFWLTSLLLSDCHTSNMIFITFNVWIFLSCLRLLQSIQIRTINKCKIMTLLSRSISLMPGLFSCRTQGGLCRWEPQSAFKLCARTQQTQCISPSLYFPFPDPRVTNLLIIQYHPLHFLKALFKKKKRTLRLKPVGNNFPLPTVNSDNINQLSFLFTGTPQDSLDKLEHH